MFKMFSQMFAMFTSLFAAADNMATWCEEESGSFNDNARLERQLKAARAKANLEKQRREIEAELGTKVELVHKQDTPISVD